jgi:hypothetical protein
VLHSSFLFCFFYFPFFKVFFLLRMLIYISAISCLVFFLNTISLVLFQLFQSSLYFSILKRNIVFRRDIFCYICFFLLTICIMSPYFFFFSISFVFSQSFLFASLILHYAKKNLSCLGNIFFVHGTCSSYSVLENLIFCSSVVYGHEPGQSFRPKLSQIICRLRKI